MNRSIGILIIFLIALSSIGSINASKLNFSGDGSLIGNFMASTTWRTDDGSTKSNTFINYGTWAGHTGTNGYIPNEAKYNDIVMIQSISGTPNPCTIILLNYNGGGISVDYDLPTSQICKGDGGRLKVTYEGKSVEAKGGHVNYWSR
jgi:hypothetical protein